MKDHDVSELEVISDDNMLAKGNDLSRKRY